MASGERAEVLVTEIFSSGLTNEGVLRQGYEVWQCSGPVEGEEGEEHSECYEHGVGDGPMGQEGHEQIRVRFWKRVAWILWPREMGPRP
mgnify:CR=1 FL=1